MESEFLQDQQIMTSKYFDTETNSEIAVFIYLSQVPTRRNHIWPVQDDFLSRGLPTQLLFS